MRYYQNPKLFAREAWVSNILLFHVLSALWDGLAKITAHHRRRQHPTLTSSSLLDILFGLQSLYCCIFQKIPCDPVIPKDTLNIKRLLSNGGGVFRTRDMVVHSCSI
jgi:hypothetical protein